MTDSNRNPDSDYLDMLSDVKFTPVFIMGLHRSGTSILYKMLSNTGQFNTVTAYHLLKYNELVYHYVNNTENQAMEDLKMLFQQKGVLNRDFGRLQIGPEFPEEYGFLLTGFKHPIGLKDNNLPIFEKLCKKIQLISKNSNMLLLKNPDDFTSFLYIKDKFPNSKFIFIHRNPLEVLTSQINVIYQIYKAKHAYAALLSETYEKTYNRFLIRMLVLGGFSPKSVIGAKRMLVRMKRHTDRYFRDIDKLPQKDYTYIKYADLCTSPSETITKITNFLELEYDYDFSDDVKSGNQTLMPSVIKIRKKIETKLADYFKEFGFNL